MNMFEGKEIVRQIVDRARNVKKYDIEGNEYDFKVNAVSCDGCIGHGKPSACMTLPRCVTPVGKPVVIWRFADEDA